MVLHNDITAQKSDQYAVAQDNKINGEQGPEWQVVRAGRKKGHREIGLNSSEVPNMDLSPRGKTDWKPLSSPTEAPKPAPCMRKPPKFAAVIITGTNSEFSYADSLKLARDKVDLTTLGIENIRVRRAINGGILIMVSGEDSTEKAKVFASKLRSVLGEIAKSPMARLEYGVWMTL